MNLYLLRTSRGSYDDYTRLILGIYESHELATVAGEKFLASVEKIKLENPCPLDEKIIENIKSYAVIESDENIQIYSNWAYGLMYDINELNLDIDIEEYQLNNTDFNNLLNIDLDYE